MWEETGYRVAVGRALCVKRQSPQVPEAFELHVFEARVIGGSGVPRGPDGEVQAAGWYSLGEVERLPFAFPEDRGLVLRFLRREQPLAVAPGFQGV